jgi:hypothetical protein
VKPAECEAGMQVSVADLPRGEVWAAVDVRLVSDTRVDVRRESDGGLYRVHPGFVSPRIDQPRGNRTR